MKPQRGDSTAAPLGLNWRETSFQGFTPLAINGRPVLSRNNTMPMGDRMRKGTDIQTDIKPGVARRAAAAKAERDKVPEIYQVVVECRHEREQQAVFERMRGEGYRCRVLTL
jgi:hypothetical protein